MQSGRVEFLPLKEEALSLPRWKIEASDRAGSLAIQSIDLARCKKRVGRQHALPIRSPDDPAAIEVVRQASRIWGVRKRSAHSGFEVDQRVLLRPHYVLVT